MMKNVIAITFALCCLQANALWPQKYAVSCVVNGVQYNRSYNVEFRQSIAHPPDGYVFVSDNIGGYEFKIKCVHTSSQLWSISWGFDGKAFSTYESQITSETFTHSGDAFNDIHGLPIYNFVLSASDCKTFAVSNGTRGQLSYINYYSAYPYEKGDIGPAFTCFFVIMCDGSEYNNSGVVFTLENDSDESTYKICRMKDGTDITPSNRSGFRLDQDAYVVETRTPSTPAWVYNDLKGDGLSVLYGVTNSLIYAMRPENIKVMTEWKFTQSTQTGGNPHALINGVNVCDGHSTSHIIDYNVLTTDNWRVDFTAKKAYCKFTMGITGDSASCVFRCWIGAETFDSAGESKRSSQSGYINDTKTFTIVYDFTQPEDGVSLVAGEVN